MQRSLALPLLAVLAPLAAGQTVQPLVSQGDTVIGVGAIERFNPAFLGMTDERMWTLTVDTDFTVVQEDQLILRNGFVTLREGASMIEPAGSLLNVFVSVDLANDGDLGMILKTRTPISDGVYWNLIRVADTETPIVSPLFGAGTTWAKLDVVKLNSRNQLFVLGEVANPDVAGNREDALVRYDLDGFGGVQSIEVLVTKAQFNPTLGTTIDGTAISPTEHVLAVNKHGDFITYVSGFGGIEAVMINADTIVGQELAPSSVGENWRTLDLTKVAINDFGDYAFSGALEGGTNDPTTYLIERNGEKFVRAGDVIEGYSTSPIAAGRAAPLWIANTGEVFWRAETQAGEATYMREYTPIVQSGTTTIDGNLVVDLPTNEHAFTISPNGRFMLGRISTLQSVGEASVLVDFGLVVSYPGCTGNPGRLFKVQGDARVGAGSNGTLPLQLAMDDGQEPGVLSIIAVATQPRVPGSDCGVVLPAGELLISPGHRVGNLFLTPWNGTGPTAINVPIPNDPALVDLRLWAQGFFRDVNGSSGEPTRMTNGLLIEVGAP